MKEYKKQVAMTSKGLTKKASMDRFEMRRSPPLKQSIRMGIENVRD